MAAAVTLFLFGGITALLSLQLPIGSLLGPGSGFFPLVLGLILMLLAGAHILQLHYSSSKPATGLEAHRAPAGSTRRGLRFVRAVGISPPPRRPAPAGPSLRGRRGDPHAAPGAARVSPRELPADAGPAPGSRDPTVARVGAHRPPDGGSFLPPLRAVAQDPAAEGVARTLRASRGHPRLPPAPARRFCDRH